MLTLLPYHGTGSNLTDISFSFETNYYYQDCRKHPRIYDFRKKKLDILFLLLLAHPGLKRQLQLRSNRQMLRNMLIFLKSILKLLVPFVIKKNPKDSVRMDLHVTITISMI